MRERLDTPDVHAATIQQSPLPQIAIITPSLNRAQTISRALASVRRQNFQAVQHIVIDGGSTDGTLEILKEYPEVQVVSEPDESSHHALNKGLSMAEGDIIGFLNTDDWYEEGAFGVVARAFANDPELDMLCGDVVFVVGEDVGKPLHSFRRGHRGGQSMFEELTLGAPAFNSWFFSRRLVEKLGKFKTEYDFSADRDFLIRGVQIGKVSSTTKLLYTYSMHAGSRTMGGDGAARRSIYREHIIMARRFLEEGDLDPRLKRCLECWRALEVARLGGLELMGLELFRAFGAVFGTFVSDPRWLWFLGKAIAAKVRMRKEDRATMQAVTIGSAMAAK